MWWLNMRWRWKIGLENTGNRKEEERESVTQKHRLALCDRQTIHFFLYLIGKRQHPINSPYLVAHIILVHCLPWQVQRWKDTKFKYFTVSYLSIFRHLYYCHLSMYHSESFDFYPHYNLGKISYFQLLIFLKQAKYVCLTVMHLREFMAFLSALPIIR